MISSLFVDLFMDDYVLKSKFASIFQIPKHTKQTGRDSPIREKPLNFMAFRFRSVRSF